MSTQRYLIQREIPEYHAHAPGFHQFALHARPGIPMKGTAMAAGEGEIFNRRHGRISTAKATFSKPWVIGLRMQSGRSQKQGGGQQE
jgi:hypothetical protein